VVAGACGGLTAETTVAIDVRIGARTAGTYVDSAVEVADFLDSTGRRCRV
jgi:hypothetical protein